MMTSSSTVRRSSFLSLGKVVGARQTVDKSVPRASRRQRSLALSVFGRNASRWASSALALSSSRRGFLPLSLETAGDKTIIRVDGAIAPLGALRFIACPFHRETPLRERTVMVGFEPLGRGNCRLDTDGRERGEHGPFHRFVNLHRTDGKAVDAATIGDVLAGAMIACGCSATRVVSTQLTTATSTDCDALQQGSSFSHGTAT